MNDWYAKYAHSAVDGPMTQAQRRHSRVSSAVTKSSGKIPAMYRAKDEKCGAVNAASRLSAAHTVYENGSLRTHAHSSPTDATTSMSVNAPAPLPVWFTESSADVNG